MKKTVLPFLLFTGIRSFSQIPELAAGNDKLKFEISPINSASTISGAKIITENIYSFYLVGPDKSDSALNSVIHYDTSGQILASTEFRGKDTLSKMYQYFYDALGNISKKRITNSQNKNQVHYTEIEYNTEGLEMVKYDYDEDSLNMMVVRKEYNRQNQCTAIAYLDKDGTFKTAKKYSYDSMGNLIKAEWFYLHSESPSKIISFKKSDNDHTEDICLNLDTIIRYKYNAAGSCTEEKRNLVKTTTGLSTNDYVITTSGKGSLGTNSLAREFSMSESYFNMASAGGDLGNGLQALGDTKTGISTINISKPESLRSASVDTIIKYHFYNDDGTVNETKIIVSGKNIATIKHFYQTR